MSTLGKKNGVYHVRFRFGNQAHKKSLQTDSKVRAEMVLYDVKRALLGLSGGVLAVPPAIDPVDFILGGGHLPPASVAPPTTVAGAAKIAQPEHPCLSVGELIAKYHAIQTHKADSSRATERIHLKNLSKWLGPRVDGPANQVKADDLQRYLAHRSQSCRHTTVGKERATIIQLFRWAVITNYLDVCPANGLPPYKDDGDDSRFKTLAEIEQILERGELKPAEQLAQWKWLYLTPAEIAGLLATVSGAAAEDYAPLLHIIPAYTGMRRGEVLRLQWKDVDFEAGLLTASSRKQSRSRTLTRRHIELHPELRESLLAWRDQRPNGQYVVCSGQSLRPLTPAEANATFREPLRHTGWCLDLKRRRYKIGFHTYRHSFASNLAAQGVDQPIIDKWMGHQTKVMRERYQHLHPRKKRESMMAISYKNQASQAG